MPKPHQSTNFNRDQPWLHLELHPDVQASHPIWGWAQPHIWGDSFQPLVSMTSFSTQSALNMDEGGTYSKSPLQIELLRHRDGHLQPPDYRWHHNKLQENLKTSRCINMTTKWEVLIITAASHLAAVSFSIKFGLWTVGVQTLVPSANVTSPVSIVMTGHVVYPQLPQLCVLSWTTPLFELKVADSSNSVSQTFCIVEKRLWSKTGPVIRQRVNIGPHFPPKSVIWYHNEEDELIITRTMRQTQWVFVGRRTFSLVTAERRLKNVENAVVETGSI